MGKRRTREQIQRLLREADRDHVSEQVMEGHILSRFDLQGHRGARGLKPENTLPSFETAFDLGVSSVETDVHLTADGAVVLLHDPIIGDKIFSRLSPAMPEPATNPSVSNLSLSQLRGYRGDKNPDPVRFPNQHARDTPLATRFARSRGIDPFGIPALADLLDFAAAYGGDEGMRAGKTMEQQARVRQVRFDLEIKRCPFRQRWQDDPLPGQLVQDLRKAGMVERAIVRSFDHRSVRAVRALQPDLTTAVLVADTAPVDPIQLVTAAGAQVYCPAYEFLDEEQVRQLHTAGIRVLPWTINDPADVSRLLDWQVDGITTDFPDRLAEILRGRGIAF